MCGSVGQLLLGASEQLGRQIVGRAREGSRAFIASSTQNLVADELRD